MASTYIVPGKTATWTKVVDTWAVRRLVDLSILVL
jgi:hypothetical protein